MNDRDVHGGESEAADRTRKRLAQIEQDAARRAAVQIWTDYGEHLRKIQNDLSLSVRNVLSAGMQDSGTVPREVSVLASRMRDRLNSIITEQASRAEDHMYAPMMKDIDSIDMMAYERTNTMRLVTTEKMVLSSWQRLKFTVDLFRYFNEVMLAELERAQRSGNMHEERRLVLNNAVLVYELSSFVIDYIERFFLQGLDEMNALYQEMIARIQQNREEIERLKQRAEQEDIRPQVKEVGLANIEARRESLDFIETEWKQYVGEINGMESNVGAVQAMLPTLKWIRDNAKNQVEFVEIMLVTQFIKESIEAVANIGLSLEQIPLVELTPARVRRLTGITDRSRAERSAGER